MTTYSSSSVKWTTDGTVSSSFTKELQKYINSLNNQTLWDIKTVSETSATDRWTILSSPNTGSTTCHDYTNIYPYINSYEQIDYPIWQTEQKLSQKLMKIKNNLIIHIKSRADLIHGIAENEQNAIETLREIITETEFRKYLKYGFILVKAKSGKTYQVFRNKNHTKVWLGGNLIEEICVRIKDSKIPLTDNVIALKTMLETNEEECRNLANIYLMKKAA